MPVDITTTSFSWYKKSWTAKSSAFCQSESGLSSISAAVVFRFHRFLCRGRRGIDWRLFSLSKQLAKAYLANEFDEICIAYTNFVSVLSQTPAVLPLLPLALTASAAPESAKSAALYEPDPQTVFNAIIPEYLGGVVYGALCESVASELAARRTAMDAATKNADEMIENLNLQFNRAPSGRDYPGDHRDRCRCGNLTGPSKELTPNG